MASKTSGNAAKSRQSKNKAGYYDAQKYVTSANKARRLVQRERKAAKLAPKRAARLAAKRALRLERSARRAVLREIALDSLSAYEQAVQKPIAI